MRLPLLGGVQEGEAASQSREALIDEESDALNESRVDSGGFPISAKDGGYQSL